MSIILAPITGGVRCCTGLERRGGGGGGRSGGEETTVILQFDTLDTKASRVGISNTSVGSEFQSLMVFGRKEEQRASGRLFHSGIMQTEVCCRRDVTQNMLAVVSLAAGSTGSCGRACQKNRSWSSGGFSPGSQLFLERYWSLSSADHS